MSELSLSELLYLHEVTGIIALKGLPCTCKTEVGDRIGRWAKCPVLCIDDCLGGSGESGYEEPDFSPPTSPDQVERHHRHAFASLLKVAHHHFNRELFNCVVIKSRLNTTNDLQQLLDLSTRRLYHGYHRPPRCRVVIVECRIRNEYLWKERFRECYSDRYRSPNYSRKWYKARSWKDVEKARDDYAAAAQSQLHLHQLFKYGPDVRCLVLVVDPFNDLSCQTDRILELHPLPAEFTNAIKYLLTADDIQELLNKQDPNDQLRRQIPYDQLRRYLFDKELSDAESKPRSESHCHGDCVFKYHQHYQAHFCHVCGDHQVSGPAYTCYFCVATLHKSCAEGLHNINALRTQTVWDYFSNYYIEVRFANNRPCQACTRGGRDFSEECRSCLFQKRLKCHVLPTILNHNFHHHFLSIHLALDPCLCKACGVNIYPFSYGCKRCASHYHLRCAFLPLELKHKHGGYNHTMKLMHSHDGLEQEEDYWCDTCYKDMDPQVWFYSCQECPNYVAHLYCAGGYKQTFNNLKDVKYVEQVQSQLEKATTGNADSIGAVENER